MLSTEDTSSVLALSVQWVPDHVWVQLVDELDVLPAEVLLPLQLLLTHVLQGDRYTCLNHPTQKLVKTGYFSIFVYYLDSLLGSTV